VQYFFYLRKSKKSVSSAFCFLFLPPKIILKILFRKGAPRTAKLRKEELD